MCIPCTCYNSSQDQIITCSATDVNGGRLKASNASSTNLCPTPCIGVNTHFKLVLLFVSLKEERHMHVICQSRSIGIPQLCKAVTVNAKLKVQVQYNACPNYHTGTGSKSHALSKMRKQNNTFSSFSRNPPNGGTEAVPQR